MTGAPIISLGSLIACLALLSIPVALSLVLELRLIRELAWGVGRMVVQLLLVGAFLKYLFLIENPLLTVAWLLIMVFFAAWSVIHSCKLPARHFFFPVLFSLVTALFFLLWYFLVVVMNRPTLFEVRYAIAVGGMLLGNSLKGNIIGITRFRDSIRDGLSRHVYRLALGATFFEAVRPPVRQAMRAAVTPMIASMSTLGIVFLPGMMTGQILGGVSPMLAVRYQIAIMVTIFTCMALGTALTLFFTIRSGFKGNGMPKDVWI
jgi:putative ABC transport system permease protein